MCFEMKVNGYLLKMGFPIKSKCGQATNNVDSWELIGTDQKSIFEEVIQLQQFSKTKSEAWVMGTDQFNL